METILVVVFCKECCRVRVRGEFQKLTEDQATVLALSSGKWKPIFILCEECGIKK
jgi:hypothetical protein